jgi:hypothetical protein
MVCQTAHSAPRASTHLLLAMNHVYHVPQERAQANQAVLSAGTCVCRAMLAKVALNHARNANMARFPRPTGVFAQIVALASSHRSVAQYVRHAGWVRTSQGLGMPASRAPLGPPRRLLHPRVALCAWLGNSRLCLGQLRVLFATQAIDPCMSKAALHVFHVGQVKTQRGLLAYLAILEPFPLLEFAKHAHKAHMLIRAVHQFVPCAQLAQRAR